MIAGLLVGLGVALVLFVVAVLIGKSIALGAQLGDSIAGDLGD